MADPGIFKEVVYGVKKCTGASFNGVGHIPLENVELSVN
jgi:hypothetical protein